MKKIPILFFLPLLFGSINLYAQQANTITRKGNKAYEEQEYSASEKQYRKALAADSSFNKAFYNLGNALYRQNRYQEAATIYDSILQQPMLNNELRTKTLHNKGNALLNHVITNQQQLPANQQQEFLKKSIEAYKQALRQNPKDQDTKYNLSYAKKLIKEIEQQQQQQQENNEQKDNEKNKDQKDQSQQQDQKKDQKQQNKQQQENQEQQKKEEQKQQQGQQEMSKEDIERILNAVQNQENQTRQKVDKSDKSKQLKIEKDW